MIANMAMSDLLYPIFLFPWFVAGMYMYVDSWPVSGRLGPILCKLSWFFPCFCRRFNSRPDSHSSRSIQSRGFRLPRSSQQYKEVLLLNFGNLVVGYSNLLTILIWCETRFNGAKIYMPFAALFFLYSVILNKLKSQKHPGERSANADVLDNCNCCI